MDLEKFRLKLKDYCRQTGNLQKALAQELGLNYSVLSNKLNGTSNARLNQPEIKQIVKTLLDWGAFNSQSEVIEFLELAGLNRASFSTDEWKAAPLKDLIDDSPAAFGSKVTPSPQNSAVAPPPKIPTAVNPADSVIGLTIPPTPLIGRDGEIEAILKLLRQKQTRLVSLLGPGGVGKTRLAGEVARQSLGSYRDGIYYVKLAPINDPALVSPTIAQLLMLKEQQGQTPLSILKKFLHDKEILLVLDNLEQIAKAAEQIGELLEAAPQLKILVTSRILLRLEGEQIFEVPPLPLPNPSGLQTVAPSELVENLLDNPAVQLFIQHSQNARPNFSLSPENLLAIAQICRQLNGLPLAIELATSRLKILSPQSLLTRLGGEETEFGQESHLLKFLVGGPQNLPARQQTIRQTLDWSYNLLEPAEKKLFARLGVFAGGCTLEAAERICNLPGEDDLEVLASMEQLVDKSIVRSREEHNGEIRFVMLQMLREYALEKLATDPAEQTRLYRQMASYFLELAEEAALYLHGPDHAIWVSRLEAERHNTRVALGWLADQASHEPEAAELAGRMVIGLYRFWWLNNYYSEGRTWLEKILVYRQHISKITLARLYHALGQMKWDQGEREAAVISYETSLALWRELGDKKGLCGVLDGLGFALNKLGNTPKALEYHRESLVIWRELGDQRNIAMSLYNQAVAEQQQGNHQLAKPLFEEALELFLPTKDIWGLELALMRLVHLTDTIPQTERLRLFYEENLVACRKYDDLRGVAISVRALAHLASKQNQHLKAAALYEESLQLFRRLNDQRATLRTLYFLGWEKLLLDEHTQPLELFSELLQSYHLLEDLAAIAIALIGFGVAASKAEQPELAAELLGLAQTLQSRTRLPLITRFRNSYEAALAISETQLNKPTFKEAFERGRSGEIGQIKSRLANLPVN